MTPRSVIFSILLHGVAGIISAGFLIFVSIVTYFICAAIGDDAGGPMVPFLIPLFCVIGGIGMAFIVYFPLSLLFTWISGRMQFACWVFPVVFFVLAFLCFAGRLAVVWERMPSPSDLGLAAFCGLFLTGGFAIYWFALSVGKKLFGRQRTASSLNNC